MIVWLLAEDRDFYMELPEEQILEISRIVQKEGRCYLETTAQGACYIVGLMIYGDDIHKYDRLIKFGKK